MVYRAGHVVSIIGAVLGRKLVTVPDVHTMFTSRHFLVAPWKQPHNSNIYHVSEKNCATVIFCE